VTAAAIARRAARPAAALLTRRWRPGSRLFLVGEGVGWVIDEELREVARLADRLGVRLADRSLLSASRGQAAFYGSQFTLLREPWRPAPHRLATAYFHGVPGTPGMPEFDDCYRALCRHHERLDRVQVSHSQMHDVVLSSGIDPAKVLRIPIGINLGYFSPPRPGERDAARAALGLPASAFVVGSFQKDGVGWGDGLEPKLVKGPDVLVETLGLLRAEVTELHVLLAGPARGYVRAGLDRLGIPWRHRYLERYEEVATLYHALDAYLVPSRQEGGPKGVLESMATRVPVVTTRVGQAMDLVRHGENGWLADVEDAAALAGWLAHVAGRPPELGEVLERGAETAAANSYDAQLPLWRAFLSGLVELP